MGLADEGRTDRMVILDGREGVALHRAHRFAVYEDIFHLIPGIRGQGEGLLGASIQGQLPSIGDAPVLSRFGGYRIMLYDKGGVDRMPGLDIREGIVAHRTCGYAIHQNIRHLIPSIRGDGEALVLPSIHQNAASRADTAVLSRTGGQGIS